MIAPARQILVSIDRHLLASLVTIIVLLTAVFMFLPQSDFNGITTEDELKQGRLIPRLHLAMATVSTVGYGDVSPKSGLARLVCVAAQLLMMLEIHSSIRDIYFKPRL